MLVNAVINCCPAAARLGVAYWLASGMAYCMATPCSHASFPLQASIWAWRAWAIAASPTVGTKAFAADDETVDSSLTAFIIAADGALPRVVAS